MYMLTKEEGGRSKPMINFNQFQMFSRTWDCCSQVNLVGKEMIMPGEDAKYDHLMINAKLCSF